MSNIFISHSSKDNEFAQKVIDFLNDNGHRSFFLDFDPVNGIPAGRNWEKELYSNLRKCKLAVALLSENFFSSRWCFAEVAQVRALGKDIIPIKIAACKVDGILSDTQVIDATSSLTEAFRRLEYGLLKAGVDKGPWNHERPPYPGLSAFDETDAAVFFGRENETDRLVEHLTNYRRHGGEKLVLILGASGSGKSSLVRAGLIPQLRKEKNTWLIIGPFRPSKQPFEELSKCLVRSFKDFQENKTQKELCDSLVADSKNSESTSTKLADLLSELIELSDEEVTIVLFIDQFEELLTNMDKNIPKENNRSLFLSYLNRFLEVASNRFLFIATLRSDFLKNFQENEHTKTIRFDDYIVPFISQEGLRFSITEPAKIAGVDLEEGLADVMIKDTGTPDALPLLAFTLEQLWKKYGKNGILTIDNYKNGLGGLEGSVAREAEAILIGHIAETKRGETVKRESGEKEARLNAEDENNLKAAFMAMVRIDEEGRYMRRTAYTSELPSSVDSLLQRFVSQRLLITSGDKKEQKIEVAHEALFRTWTRLANWLEQDKGFLIWRKRLNISLEEWKRTNKDDSELLRGPALTEAIGRLQEHWAGKYVLILDEIEFIKAAEMKYEEERIKEEQRKKELEEKNKQLQLALNEAKAKTLAAVARQVANKNKTLAMRIAEAACKTTANVTREAQAAFVDIIKAQPPLYTKSFLHQKGVRAVAFSPDGQSVLTGCDDNIVRLWALEGNKVIEYHGHNQIITCVAFLPDGKHVLAGSGDGVAIVWSLEGAPVLNLKAHKGGMTSVAISRDGRNIVTGGLDFKAVLWKLEEQVSIPLSKENRYIFSVAFSPDGETVLTASSRICFWDVKGDFKFGVENKTSVKCLVYSIDGQSLLAASGNVIRLLDLNGESLQEFRGHTAVVNSVAFSPDGNFIASASDDNTLRLWDLQGNVLQVFEGHTDKVVSVAFSPDGQFLISGSRDNTAHLWNLKLNAAGVVSSHEKEIRFTFFKGERSIIAGDRRNIVSLIDLGGRRKVLYEGPDDFEVYLFGTYLLKTNKLLLARCTSFEIHVIDDLIETPIIFKGEELGGVISVTFSNSGNFIMVVFANAVWLCNRAGDVLHKFTYYDNTDLNNTTISSVAFSPHETSVFVESASGNSARLWDFKGNLLQTFDAQIPNDSVVFPSDRKFDITVSYSSAVFSPDGKHIYTAGRWGIHQWDLQGQLLNTFYDYEFVNAFYDYELNYEIVKVLPKNSFLLATRGNKTVQLLNSEGRVLQIFEGHSGPITSLDFSSDYNWIVTGSEDKTVKIWRPYWEMIKPENTYVPTPEQMKEFEIAENIEWGKIW